MRALMCCLSSTNSVLVLTCSRRHLGFGLFFRHGPWKLRILIQHLKGPGPSSYRAWERSQTKEAVEDDAQHARRSLDGLILPGEVVGELWSNAEVRQRPLLLEGGRQLGLGIGK